MGKIATAGLGTLGLVTACLVTVAVAQPNQPTVSAEPRPSFTTTTSASPEPVPTIESADLGAAVSRLDDKAASWTLTVLGDSTGNDGDEWVANLARTIATEKVRPVTYYSWDAAAATYAAPVTYGRGSGEPVTIWNGSASGMGPDYSLANLPALAPQASDLLIVNHGHNYVSPEQGSVDEAALVVATSSQWQNTPAVAVVLQNPRVTEAEAQEANLAAITSTFTGSSYTLVEVASAYREQPDLSALLQADGTHPNAAGQTLWSDTINSALGL